MKIEKLTDQELLQTISALAGKERDVLTDFLLHLIEVESRSLHLSQGYSSMFDYLTRGLKFSEPAAARRLRAARCLKDNPEAETMLKNGELNLTTLCQASSVVKSESVSIEKFSGVSSRKAGLIAAEHKHAPKKKLKDIVKPIGKRKTNFEELPLLNSTVGADSSENKDLAPVKHKVSFEAGGEFVEKLEEVKAVLSNKLGAGASLEEVLGACMEVCLEKHCPKRKEARRVKREGKRFSQTKPPSNRPLKGSSREEGGPRPSKAEGGTKSQSPYFAKATKGRQKKSVRHIPARVRAEVMRRDQYQCSYKSADGKRCGCKSNLQIDHVIPFAVGGKSELDNLRVLCRAHNQFEAVQAFGQGLIRQCIERSKAA